MFWIGSHADYDKLLGQLHVTADGRERPPLTASV